MAACKMVSGVRSIPDPNCAKLAQANPISRRERESAMRAGYTLSGLRWPLKVPEWSAAKNRRHAKNAVIGFISKGRGRESDYPAILKKLAALYSPQSDTNREIWTAYQKVREKVAETARKRTKEGRAAKIRLKYLPAPATLRNVKRRAAPVRRRKKAANNSAQRLQPIRVVRGKSWKLPQDAILFFKGQEYPLATTKHLPGNRGDVGYAVPTWNAFRAVTKGQNITATQLSNDYRGMESKARTASRRRSG